MTKRFDPSSILRAGRAFAADLLFHVRHELPRFKSDRRGNVAMIFAYARFRSSSRSAQAIDYTSATRRKAKLDAIADTAALSTVTLSGNPPAYSPIPGEGLDLARCADQGATNVQFARQRRDWRDQLQRNGDSHRRDHVFAAAA